ncbi:MULTISPECIES: hypothetical protein [unclassified Streptomyces]|uniref:hypothetical protein n=1 Tax=unclassified Streptomyces TaxID=2593676 RepID=UPI000DB90787|nr:MULTISPECIES: hypothetical protein [unclassified Streptomyces]MYT71389.1 hypothetical protein [Streptomyces sp. SID8367]RAJ82849.1 hypothetical protein K377_03900 [Streptomyces sp. PsTaAH-137]
MKHTRTVAWAGITLAALTATTACSADTARKTAGAVGHAGSVMAALTRASDKASGLGSAQVETTTVLTASGGKPVAMNGTYSWGDGTAMDLQMDTANAKMSSLQDDPTMQVKVVDGAYFYEIDPQPSGPLKGKHWARVDVSAVLGEAGADSAADNADPTTGLRYLGASKNVKVVGKETVRGKKAVHYRGSIGADQVTGNSRFSAAEKKAALKSLATSGGRLTYDIWVDGDDLPVRVKQHGGGMDVTMDYLKFGATKPITAPPVSDTGDLTDMVEKQRDQSLGQ